MDCQLREQITFNHTERSAITDKQPTIPTVQSNINDCCPMNKQHSKFVSNRKVFVFYPPADPLFNVDLLILNLVFVKSHFSKTWLTIARIQVQNWFWLQLLVRSGEEIKTLPTENMKSDAENLPMSRPTDFV